MVRLVGNVLLMVLTAESVAFVVLYAWWARWWESATGRHLMAFMATFAAVLLLSVLRLVLHDSITWQVLRLAVFAGLPVVVGQRLWLLYHAQHPQRRGATGGRRGSGRSPRQ